ncbi:MAG: hypothetical protein WD971_11250 [Pirellulales bacterium]
MVGDTALGRGIAPALQVALPISPEAALPYDCHDLPTIRFSLQFVAHVVPTTLQIPSAECWQTEDVFAQQFMNKRQQRQLVH